MTTYSSLVDEIVTNLQGMTISPDQVTFLSGDVTSVATNLMVDDITQVGAGVAQIDDELVWVKGVDTSTATVIIAPFGRGWRSTLAAAHTTNTALYMAPNFPRATIKREINRSLAALYPTLFAVQPAGAITTDGITYQFDLPIAAEAIVDVRWLFNSFDGWQRAVKWEAEFTSPAGFGATGRYLSIYETLPAGATVQVLYKTRPQPFLNDSDDFVTVTGLDESCADLVTLSVMAKMAQFIDVGRLPSESASADALAQQRPTGGPTQIAAQLRKQYQERLADEQRALSQRYPVRGHKVR